MGWLDRTVAASFKKNAAGRDLFFVWGKLGKGRVVPSEAECAWLRLYLKIYYVCVIAVIGPLLVIGKVMRSSLEWSTIGIFAVVYAAVVIGPWIPLWLRVRLWPIAGERELTIRDAMSASANEMGPTFLWFGIVCSGLMAAGGLFLLAATDQTVAATLIVIVFGAALGFLVWMLQARQRG